jgi:hypothetical protein
VQGAAREGSEISSQPPLRAAERSRQGRVRLFSNLIIDAGCPSSVRAAARESGRQRHALWKQGINWIRTRKRRTPKRGLRCERRCLELLRAASGWHSNTEESWCEGGLSSPEKQQVYIIGVTKEEEQQQNGTLTSGEPKKLTPGALHPPGNHELTLGAVPGRTAYRTRTLPGATTATRPRSMPWAQLGC